MFYVSKFSVYCILSVVCGLGLILLQSNVFRCIHFKLKLILPYEYQMVLKFFMVKFDTKDNFLHY